MEDITNFLLQMQNAEILPPPSEEVSKECFKLSGPIFIEPKQRLFKGYKRLIFVRSSNSSIKGIYWENETSTDLLAYLYREETRELQYIKNNKVIWQKKCQKNDELADFKNKLSLFLNMFKQRTNLFKTMAGKDYFAEHNLPCKTRGALS